ncbi:MAG: protease complex subunit PrcB family protein, partial [Bacteroidales bacterium]|nr:protease complex subunit PrcB family protein [Bacteroidales bacterium]
QVIAIFGKVKENGGWDIEVTKITEYTDSIVVTYSNIETGNLVDTVAQPFQIVRIPASDKNIVFPDSGNVVYRSCCDEERGLSGLNDIDWFRKGETYLFNNDSVPNKNRYSYTRKSWIVFDSTTNSARLIFTEGMCCWECGICNFPDFAKEWDIPENGCKVYFEGRVYRPCIEKGGIAAYVWTDYVLTVLKRK